MNADVTNKLIAYLEGDPSKMIVVTAKVLLVMDKALERLDRRPIAYAKAAAPEPHAQPAGIPRNALGTTALSGIRTR